MKAANLWLTACPLLVTFAPNPIHVLVEGMAWTSPLRATTVHFQKSPTQNFTYGSLGK